MPIYRDMDEVGAAPNVVQDQQSLRRRHDALANLASATDGIAVTNSNDLDAGLRRIADDLTHTCIGYYSTNAKLDGRFRTIAVRVKRPGVEIRARRGYRAPTEAEVASARRAAAPPAATTAVNAVASAVTALTRVRPDARFRMHAIPVRGTDGGPVTTVWVAGELPPSQQGWAQGGTVVLDITGAGASGGVQVTLKPGERAFLTPIPVQGAAASSIPYSIDVRGRLTSPIPR